MKIEPRDSDGKIKLEDVSNQEINVQSATLKEGNVAVPVQGGGVCASKKLVIGLIVGFLVIAGLVIGLSVGLTRKK